MAFTISDRLQELFPHWSLDRRTTIWLWLTLRARETTHYLGDFDTPGMRDRMAYLISNGGIAGEIDNSRNQAMVPENILSWIEKDGRQHAWLLRQLERNQQNIPLYLSPIGLTQREILIATLDFLATEKLNKQFILNQLKAAWVQQQLQDKQFSWYASAGKEKQKCQIAWQWYHDHHKQIAVFATEFSRLEDILEFLDGTNFSLEEKLHHLEQIKKKFKAQQTQANRRGKTQTNISLSDVARLQLDALAEKERRTKTEVIELLIRSAHEHGMPH